MTRCTQKFSGTPARCGRLLLASRLCRGDLLNGQHRQVKFVLTVLQVQKPAQIGVTFADDHCSSNATVVANIFGAYYV